MPSWGLFRKRPAKPSKQKRRSGLTVRWDLTSVDKRRNSDTESQSSSAPSEVPSEASDQPGSLQLDDLAIGASCISANPGFCHLQDSEDEVQRQLLTHLNSLGMALENTFKEVESIDAFVMKMKADFDKDMVTEQRFMSCICSAKIARSACCKKQIHVWQKLQHDIWEFCCCHRHHHQETLTRHRHDSDDSMACDSDSNSSSMSSHDIDVECAIHQLRKTAFFDLIWHRLDPRSDVRSFMDNWVMQGHHQGDSHH